jgi:hypothetical protein
MRVMRLPRVRRLAIPAPNTSRQITLLNSAHTMSGHKSQNGT